MAEKNTKKAYFTTDELKEDTDATLTFWEDRGLAPSKMYAIARLLQIGIGEVIGVKNEKIGSEQ